MPFKTENEISEEYKKKCGQKFITLFCKLKTLKSISFSNDIIQISAIMFCRIRFWQFLHQYIK